MNKSRLQTLRAIRHQIETRAAQLDDVTALEVVEMFPKWEAGKAYAAGERLRYAGILYKVLQAHTSQAGWEPDKAVSLFTRVLIPDPEVIPEWEQPSSTNPYMAGDKVKHAGKIWQSDVDNNVWEPGTTGAPWTQID